MSTKQSLAVGEVRGLFSDCKDRLDHLAARWQDEKEYEDFNEYADAMRKLVKDPKMSVVKTSKRPFGFTVRHAEAPSLQFVFFASGNKVGMKVIQGRAACAEQAQAVVKSRPVKLPADDQRQAVVKSTKKFVPATVAAANARPVGKLPADGSIPKALDRTAGMDRKAIDSLRDKLIAKDKKRSSTQQAILTRGITSPVPKQSNLTAADEKAIAELTKQQKDEKAAKQAARLNKLLEAKGKKPVKPKQTAAEKPKAEKPKADNKPSIAAITVRGILAGKDDDAILVAIRKVHPGRSNASCVRWYRGQMDRKSDRVAALVKEAKADRPTKAA